MPERDNSPKLTIELINGDSIVVTDEKEIAKITQRTDGQIGNGKVVLKFKAEDTVYRVNLDSIAYMWEG